MLETVKEPTIAFGMLVADNNRYAHSSIIIRNGDVLSNVSSQGISVRDAVGGLAQ
jgi:hypothetical protein